MMVLFNVLFYRFLQLKIYRSLYWAIMFTSIIQFIILLPTVIILLRVNYGCRIMESSDSTIKITLSIFCVVFLALNFKYYSSSRSRKLREHFSQQSKSKVWLKTILAILGCFSVLFFSDNFWSLFFDIPQC